MVLIVLISLSILAPYVWLILSYLKGWNKTKAFETAEQPIYKGVISILLPFRDEAKNLPAIFDCLSRQQYPAALFEIIAVNDHSSDESCQIVKEYVATKTNTTLLHLNENEAGKKKSIQQAMAICKGSLIICIDADITVEPNWLKTISCFYAKHQPAMIIAPVLIKNSHTLFEKCQTVEFLSLMGTTGGSAGVGMPIMCNGANLSFAKSAYIQYNTADNKYLSGDDIFLMQELYRHHEKIIYLKSTDAVAMVDAPETLRSFLMQRARWASKTSGYVNRHVILVAWLVFLMSFIIICTLSLSVFNPHYLWIPISLWEVKIIVDYLMIKKTANFFHQKFSVVVYLLTALVYPIYIVVTAFVSFNKNIGWKGRKIVVAPN